MEDRKIRSFPLSFATFLLFHDSIEFQKKDGGAKRKPNTQ
jgi:hypothetical protein